jgi:membrane protease YdiL (CAAX protease family)
MSVPVPPRPDLGLVDEPTLEDLRPKATWRWYMVILFTVLGFVAGSLLATPLLLSFATDTAGLPDDVGLLAVVIVDLVMALVLVLWLRSAHPGWVRIVGWAPRGSRARAAVVGAGLGFAVVEGSFVAGGIVSSVLHALTGEEITAVEQVSSSIAGWGVVVLLLLSIVVAPVVEEFVFRGLLFRSIADRRGFWLGAIVSAVLFGLTHWVPGRALDVLALMITLMFVGVGFAWIHWRRRNLLANIAGHAAFNVIGVVLILSDVRV